MLDDLYYDVGGKLKIIAKAVCVIGTILFIICAIIMFVSGLGGVSVLTGVLYLILGPLFSWVSSLFLYGFGVLIDDVEALSSDEEAISQETPSLESHILFKQQAESNMWTCPECGTKNAHYIGTCACGKDRP